MAHHRVTYDSIGELARKAMPYLADGTYKYGPRDAPSFCGVRTITELKELARDGWSAEAAEAMDIAEAAVETTQQDHDMTAFRPVWDVAGCEVDVARYLSGEPENMIDYEIVSTPRSGRVIVLCVSLSYSAAVSAAAIKRRGHGIAALAFALSKMGLTLELWGDMSSKSGSHIGSTRVLIKGANDELDPARIMFAVAHPGMLRALAMPERYSWPQALRKRHQVGSGFGMPVDPVRDLPEGTIYLPSVCSNQDVPDAKELLVKHLAELGLLGD